MHRRLKRKRPAKQEVSDIEFEMAHIIHHAVEGEYPQALIRFVRLAETLRNSDGEWPPILPRLLKILWEEISLSIEERCEASSVEEMEQQLEEQRSTRIPGHSVEVFIEELELLIGVDERLAQEFAERHMLELFVHHERVLAMSSGRQRFSPDALIGIARSFTNSAPAMTMH